jgi:hypothetical protein
VRAQRCRFCGGRTEAVRGVIMYGVYVDLRSALGAMRDRFLRILELCFLRPLVAC